MDDPGQLVSFGTSGHRGTSTNGTFNEAHIAAITQAICEYRQQAGIGGPLFLGKDTHALSAPAQNTALEVLVANGVETVIQENDGFTPTPVISRQILAHNREALDGTGRWDCDHSVAQSACRRRFQIQSAARRTGRFGCDRSGFRIERTSCCEPGSGVKRIIARVGAESRTACGKPTWCGPMWKICAM